MSKFAGLLLPVQHVKLCEISMQDLPGRRGGG